MAVVREKIEGNRKPSQTLLCPVLPVNFFTQERRGQLIEFHLKYYNHPEIFQACSACRIRIETVTEVRNVHNILNHVA